MAAGTMGTCVTWTSKPIPCSSRYAHDPAGGIQAEGRSPREQDRVHMRNEVHGGERVHLSAAGRGTPNIHPTHRAFRAEDDGAAGTPVRVGAVPDPES